MKKAMSLLLCVLLFGVSICGLGCAGRKPNPVSIQLNGDESLNCKALSMQRQQCYDEMKKLKPKCNKFVTNTAWFVVFPFLMDVKDAEKVEYDAFSRRANYITSLLVNKDCPDANKAETSKKTKK